MNQTSINSLGFITILAIVGTGLAKVLYNKMVHLATPIFASSVTYLIPIVAVFWGILDGEKLSLIQVICRSYYFTWSLFGEHKRNNNFGL